jgi:hypothetical protein
MDELRPASFERDGWQLGSAVFRNQEFPDTFKIPDEGVREALQAGDFVKLIFEYEIEEGDEDSPSAERMWVEVTDRAYPFYIGALANEPYAARALHVLKLGTKIVFLPEHVADID